MEELLADLRAKMLKAYELTVEDVGTIRSGRATPALVEPIVVTAYEGTQTLKLMEMATITTMDAKTIVVAPYDPSVIDDIEKGITDANIGLTPSVDGEVIRITIPPLSEERRQEYLKLARAKLEAGKVMIRQVRQEGIKDVKRMEDEKEISEDDRHLYEKKIQTLTDEMIGNIDALAKKKEEELLQV